MKKLVVLISSIIIILIIVIIIINIPKSYQYEYKIDDFNILEKYDKNNKIYTFKIKTKDESYDYAFKEDYQKKKGLIKKIKLSNNCLDVSLEKIDSFSICQNKDGYYTKYLNDEDNTKKKSSYENIDIYNLNNHTYLIWNYNYFIGLNEKKKEKITLFDNDFLKLDVALKYQDNLVIGDYNEEYLFDKFYVINAKKMKVDTVKINIPIYLNSYFLGEYQDSLYLFDMQAKQEYEIDLDEGLVYRINPMVLVNGKWEDSSIIKLTNKEEVFTYEENFNYVLENNKLYYKTSVNKILVSNLDIDKLIYQDGKEAYFLVKDTLYYVHLDKGIKKLLSYSEWQFNNSNIYIF